MNEYVHHLKISIDSCLWICKVIKGDNCTFLISLVNKYVERSKIYFKTIIS